MLKHEIHCFLNPGTQPGPRSTEYLEQLVESWTKTYVDKQVCDRGSLGWKVYMSYLSRRDKYDSAGDTLTIDSASSCHIEVDIQKEARWVKPNNDPSITISCLDKEVHYTVTHYGDVPGYGKVYVVPQRDGILASVSQLTKNGYKVQFDEHQVITMHPDYENVYGSRNQYDHYTVDR
jgi:hypothetical protein